MKKTEIKKLIHEILQEENEKLTATDVKNKFRDLGTKIPQNISTLEATIFLQLLENILNKMTLGEIANALDLTNKFFTTKTQNIKPAQTQKSAVPTSSK